LLRNLFLDEMLWEPGEEGCVFWMYFARCLVDDGMQWSDDCCDDEELDVLLLLFLLEKLSLSRTVVLKSWRNNKSSRWRGKL